MQLGDSWDTQRPLSHGCSCILMRLWYDNTPTESVCGWASGLWRFSEMKLVHLPVSNWSLNMAFVPCWTCLPFVYRFKNQIKFDFEGGASMKIGSINKNVRSKRHRSMPLTGKDLISIKLDASTGKQIASVDLQETLSVCCQGCLIKTHY